MGTGIVEFRQLREVGVFFYLDIICLKSHENGFGCCEAGNGHGFRFQEVVPMLDEGSSLDSPRTGLGLLKIVLIACWIEIVHLKLFELNDLKCVWKMIC